MASDLVLVQNDTKPDLIFTIIDSENNIIDISDHTVRFKFRKCGTIITLFSRICTNITDGTDGKCKLVWTIGDLANIGDYEAELELTSDLDGSIQTVPKNLTIRIRAEFANP